MQWCHRDFISAQNLAGFVSVQAAPTGDQGNLDDATGGFGIGRELLRDRGGSLHQQFLIPPVLGQAHESLHRFAGRLIGGNVRGLEQLARRLHRRLADPAGHDQSPATGPLDQCLRAFHRAIHRGGCMQHQYPVGARFLQ